MTQFSLVVVTLRVTCLPHAERANYFFPTRSTREDTKSLEASITPLASKFADSQTGVTPDEVRSAYSRCRPASAVVSGPRQRAGHSDLEGPQEYDHLSGILSRRQDSRLRRQGRNGPPLGPCRRKTLATGGIDRNVTLWDMAAILKKHRTTNGLDR
jgi:hypothetical protein